MKKYFILFLTLISFTLLSLNTSAASWRYEWENETVVVPVGESLEKYKYKPSATLYKDGYVVNDAKITYLRDGDWLYYLSDVNTSVVGVYEVWYKAFENTYKPGTCPGYKCKIKFVVEDKTKPSIKILNPVVRLRMGDVYDYTSNVSVSDNYDDNPRIEFSNTVDTSKAGVYSLSVYAIDSSGNTESKTFDVEVLGVYPSLIYKNEGAPIVVSKDSSIILRDYFAASDLIDGDITSQIKSSDIDTSRIGSHEITVYVENSNQLRTELQVTITVVDDVRPAINLNTKEVVLDYTTSFDTYDFMQHIMSIEDNDEIDYANLSITNNLLNAVGRYNVKYTYTDSSFTAEEVLSVQLISYQKPRITTTAIVCVQGEPVDIWNYFQIYDPSDAAILDRVEVYYEEVDFFTPGLYYAEIYAINSSGLSSSAKIAVTVQPAIEEVEETKTENTFFSGGDSKVNIKDICLITIILILIGFICFHLISMKKRKRFK